MRLSYRHCVQEEVFLSRLPEEEEEDRPLEEEEEEFLSQPLEEDQTSEEEPSHSTQEELPHTQHIRRTSVSITQHHEVIKLSTPHRECECVCE